MRTATAALRLVPAGPVAPMRAFDTRRAGEYIDSWQQLVAERQPWNQRSEEVARYLAPHYRGSFYTDYSRPDDFRTDSIFHSGPQTHLERFVAVMQSQITPSQTVWFRLEATEPELQAVPEVSRWYDEVTRRTWEAIYRPSAGFVANIALNFESQGITGLGVLYTDRLDGELGIRHSFVHPADIWYATDHQGQINLVFRRLRLTARQAKSQFGDRLPRAILRAAESSAEWNREYIFLHVVSPNSEVNPRARNHYASMPWASCYIALEDKMIVDEGGYTTMPYTITRYRRSPDKRGPIAPGYVALPDIRLLNEATKVIIKAAQRRVDPPILAHADVEALVLSLIPGGHTYGALSDDGREMMKAMEFGDVEFGVEFLERLERRVGQPLLADLFQFTLGTVNKDMTAREVARREQEIGMQLYPVVDGQASDFAGPFVTRCVDLQNQMGRLPPMPRLLQQLGADYRILFDAPLARALRMQEAAGYLEMEQYANNMDAQSGDPVHKRVHFLKADKAMPEISMLKGVPSRWLATEDEVAEIRDGITQQLEQQQKIDSAQGTAALLDANTRATQGANGGPTGK